MRAQHQQIGFNARSGQVGLMQLAHMHTDFEVNYLLKGELTYFFAGEFIKVLPRQLVIFWAGMPHRVTQVEAGSEFIWLTVPLAWVLQWELPTAFMNRLLGGQMLREEDPSRADLDYVLMKQWAADVHTPNRLIALLEIEARWRRFAAAMKAERTVHQSGPVDPIERVTRFIGAHYADPLTVAQIASEVELHPNYLMNLFRRHCGLGLWDYVVRLRVSHAQRLLLTTDWKIVDVALAAGFGSVSRFHAAFRRYCHLTPRQYRKTSITALTSP